MPSSTSLTMEIEPSSETFLLAMGEDVGCLRSRAHRMKVDFPTPVQPKTTIFTSCNELPDGKAAEVYH